MARIADATIQDEQLYWDHRFQRHTIKLLPGDFTVVNGRQMLVTVLGSCVAACIRDSQRAIGGMNHFLLPYEKNRGTARKWNDYESESTRYGDLAMEQLINKIISLGGQREYLEAKIFGGAKMFNVHLSDIGRQNIEFVMQYLKTEKIKIASEDTGGIHARKIYYIPANGDVFLKRITETYNSTIEQREKRYMNEVKQTRTTAEISFFD